MSSSHPHSTTIPSIVTFRFHHIYTLRTLHSCQNSQYPDSYIAEKAGYKHTTPSINRGSQGQVCGTHQGRSTPKPTSQSLHLSLVTSNSRLNLPTYLQAPLSETCVSSCIRVFLQHVRRMHHGGMGCTLAHSVAELQRLHGFPVARSC